MLWHDAEYEDDKDARDQANGRAFQELRKGDLLKELAKLDEEQAALENRLNKIAKRKEEINRDVSFINNLLKNEPEQE